MTRAVLYIRCSTTEQELSPDAQREAARRWCAQNDVELADTFEDIGVSGGAELDKRPGLVRCIDAIGPEVTILLVAKRDRLARDYLVAGLVERLVKRKGGTIRSCDGTSNADPETPEGFLVPRLLDVLSDHERRLIRARTRAALAVKRARGEYLGGPVPWGWTIGNPVPGAVPNRKGAVPRLLAPNEAERELLALALRYEAEGWSLRAIGRLLARRGLTPRKGGPWRAQGIKELLAGARALGLEPAQRAA